jgi:hypothetical protein
MSTYPDLSGLQQARQGASDGARPESGLQGGSTLQGRSKTTTRRRLVAAAVLVLGVAGASGLALKIRSHAPRRRSIARIGQPLPALPAFDSSGQRVDIGKIVESTRSIVVFYSPSCEVCEAELPKLQPFPAALRLIMVSETEGGSSHQFADLESKCLAMLYDRDRVLERSFPLPALPTILFVDEQGVLRGALLGAHDQGMVQGKLAEFSTSNP